MSGVQCVGLLTVVPQRDMSTTPVPPPPTCRTSGPVVSSKRPIVGDNTDTVLVRGSDTQGKHCFKKMHSSSTIRSVRDCQLNRG